MYIHYVVNSIKNVSLKAPSRGGKNGSTHCNCLMTDHNYNDY